MTETDRKKHARLRLLAILAHLDCFGMPREKMPRCPECREDELGVTPKGIFCYWCGWQLDPHAPHAPEKRTAMQDDQALRWDSMMVGDQAGGLRSGWHTIADGMPPADVEVLCLDNRGDFCLVTWTGIQSESRSGWEPGRGSERDFVTHWCALPPRPSEIKTVDFEAVHAAYDRRQRQLRQASRVFGRLPDSLCPIHGDPGDQEESDRSIALAKRVDALKKLGWVFVVRETDDKVNPVSVVLKCPGGDSTAEFFGNTFTAWQCAVELAEKGP